MSTTIEIWLPVHPGVFAVFLGIIVLYLVYVGMKFVISLWTGA